MLIWCATGIVRGRARSGRLRWDWWPSGVVGLARTQVGLTMKGSWRCGRRVSKSRARRRRMQINAMTRSSRNAAPPMVPPSSAPKSLLVLLSLGWRTRRCGGDVPSKAQAETSMSDIGDVVAGMEGVVDGGQKKVGDFGQNIAMAPTSRARPSRISGRHVCLRLLSSSVAQAYIRGVSVHRPNKDHV
ncbi:hypothetical protein B0H14DRAFT_2867951 [Mycena olivaceomarginata]|nr:hypothetical protein B0H14DRAFT_2867951 [Mycena olivaceomarginata]